LNGWAKNANTRTGSSFYLFTTNCDSQNIVRLELLEKMGWGFRRRGELLSGEERDGCVRARRTGISVDVWIGRRK
jgi:hypothetical protein